MADARAWALPLLVASALVLLLLLLVLVRLRRARRLRPPPVAAHAVPPSTEPPPVPPGPPAPRPARVEYRPAREVFDPQWERARTIPTRRGDKVRSWGEARVADWLHARGIRYEYEPLVLGRRPDFLLPDLGVIVEYSGVRKQDYERRHAERLRAYADAGIPCITLQGTSWTRMEAQLDEELRRHGWGGGDQPRR